MTPPVLTETERNRRASIVLQAAINDVEAFANRYDSERESDRVSLAALLCGIAFAAVVSQGGWLRALRTLVGCLIVGVKHRDVVRV